MLVRRYLVTLFMRHYLVTSLVRRFLVHVHDVKMLKKFLAFSCRKLLFIACSSKPVTTAALAGAAASTVQLASYFEWTAVKGGLCDL